MPTPAPSSVFHLGEVSCLLAALCWALAVALFRGPIARHGPWAVNLAKNCLGTVLLGLTAAAFGQLLPLAQVSLEAWIWIATSGVVGLTLGDTALFAAVDRLGSHRALLFLTLGPVFAAILARLAFGEVLGPARIGGGLLVLVGVATVVWTPAGQVKTPDTTWSIAGIVYGVLGAFGLGAGVVLAKGGLAEMPVLGASFVRMVSAVVSLLIWMTGRGLLARALRGLNESGALKALAAPAFLGTYVSFLLMMLGIHYAPASVASVLLALPPVFGLFIDAKLFGAPITVRGLAGTALAVFGVAVLTLYG